MVAAREFCSQAVRSLPKRSLERFTVRLIRKQLRDFLRNGGRIRARDVRRYGATPENSPRRSVTGRHIAENSHSCMMASTALACGRFPAVQTTPGPFGVAETTARNLMNAAARNPRSLGNTGPFVTTVRHAYERLPAGARASAVTAAFAWAKAYVSSAAFATAYAAARQQAKPAGVSVGPSVDEELKTKVDDQRASLEESKKGVVFVPEADRAAVLKAFSEAEDRLRDPEVIKAWRADIQSRHDADTRGTAEAVARWNALYPSETGAFVRQELERFLAGSADVDFSIPITLIKTGGVIVGFVGPFEGPVGSWITAECLLAGKDMVAAARAAVESWLKELPK